MPHLLRSCTAERPAEGRRTGNIRRACPEKAINSGNGFDGLMGNALRGPPCKPSSHPYRLPLSDSIWNLPVGRPVCACGRRDHCAAEFSSHLPASCSSRERGAGGHVAGCFHSGRDPRTRTGTRWSCWDPYGRKASSSRERGYAAASPFFVPPELKCRPCDWPGRCFPQSS
ncbi:hypothetical protein CALVIDRAFT_124027 [Calocera viscosa TUFC12733]|uniref:Uncharacterized protein n=1 Tax=Calocera viscosa (strain TUFC12733) TaxID=1330018 RepID=A0A167RPG9_CALVF|nr:hypothetical protein CALVIDRAFT_124027 [Calocera viscosa TUFC12733]